MTKQTSAASTPEKLLTPEQTADILGISPGTLQVWRSVGRYNLPFVKVGAKVKYHPGDVQDFIDSRTLRHTA